MSFFVSDWLQLSGPGAGGVASSRAGAGGSTQTGTSVADRAVFFAGFGTPILPGSDYGTRHIVLRSSAPAALYAVLTSPPASGDFLFDIQVSQDGIAWNSILLEPQTIPAGCGTVVSTTAFSATTSNLAPGNMLRLVVLYSGDPPAFSSGFACAISLDSDSVPGWDRATFALGFGSAVPIGVDLGAYWIATRTCTPSTLYCSVKVPPAGGSVELDIQVQQDGIWTSIFPPANPLVVSAGLATVISSGSFNGIQINPGDLVRAILLSGPPISGTGYIVSLELEVLIS